MAISVYVAEANFTAKTLHGVASLGGLLAVAFLATSISTGGCSSGKLASVVDAASEGGGGSGEAGSGGGVCNMLTNIGTDVPWMSDPGPVPVMTGGTIVDGIYVLTSSVNYGGVSAPSANATSKFTIAIAGNTTQFVASYNGGPDVHSTTEGIPTGIQLNAVQTCPGGAQVDGSYTATPTSLTVRPIRDAAHEDYHVVIFTKQ
jgi:hypothetical protein